MLNRKQQTASRLISTTFLTGGIISYPFCPEPKVFALRLRVVAENCHCLVIVDDIARFYCRVDETGIFRPKFKF